MKQKDKQSTTEQHVNECIWLCSNKIFFTKTGGQSTGHRWSIQILDESRDKLQCLTFHVEFQVHCVPPNKTYLFMIMTPDITGTK